MKFLLSRALVALIISSSLLSTSWSQGDFYLEDGDCVVFYGDSITDQRLYTTFVESFVVTRFPDLTIDFVHSGWGGDRVSGGKGGGIDQRLERDVFAYSPTVVTLMLGMNDGRYRVFEQETFDTYVNGINYIVDRVQSNLPDARMTLIQPSPYDDITRAPKFSGGYNSVLVRYGEAIREIAEAGQHNLADFNSPITDMLSKAKDVDAKLAGSIIRDRVHPRPAGHLIMAEQLLKSWNAPSLISSVEIDAAAVAFQDVANADVSGLRIAGGRLEWLQRDRALPMPVDLANVETALAIASSDFVEALNQQILRVTGLTGIAYKLKIDGDEIGTFTASQLSSGLNLAMLKTPMSEQAAAVHKLTRQRSDMHNMRWRTYQVPYANASEEIQSHLPDLLESMDIVVSELSQLQRAKAKPISHQFQLVEVNAKDSLLEGYSVSSVPDHLGDNLALGKTWLTRNRNTHGWDSGLTDGSWLGSSDFTFATDDSDVFPKSVTVDLGGVFLLGHALVGVPGFGSTKTVKVELSADGTDFTMVGNYAFSFRREEKRLFDFYPLSARYVRLTYVDHYQKSAGYSPNYAFTTDVQVFAPLN